MMAILSQRDCDECKVPLHKNPHISGDYDITGKLISFCPICGKGYPAVGISIEIISNRKLQTLSSRTAGKYGLSYKDVDNLVEKLRGKDKYFAVIWFKNEILKRYDIDLPPEIFVDI